MNQLTTLLENSFQNNQKGNKNILATYHLLGEKYELDIEKEDHKNLTWKNDFKIQSKTLFIA